MYEKNKTIRNGRLPCVRATLSTVMMILMYRSYFPTISIDLYFASILKHFFLSPNLCQCPSKDSSIPLPFSCPNRSSPTRTHLTVVIVYIYERKKGTAVIQPKWADKDVKHRFTAVPIYTQTKLTGTHTKDTNVFDDRRDNRWRVITNISTWWAHWSTLRSILRPK